MEEQLLRERVYSQMVEREWMTEVEIEIVCDSNNEDRWKNVGEEGAGTEILIRRIKLHGNRRWIQPAVNLA